MAIASSQVPVSGNVQLKKNPLPESASELYRSSDRRMSAKLVPNLRIEGATWST
jgi:hypothetical protein